MLISVSRSAEGRVCDSASSKSSRSTRRSSSGIRNAARWSDRLPALRRSRLKPASLRLAALLDRPARREVPVTIDFCGFVIPDRFVIGYGLDYAGLYRELPGIYSLN